MASDLIDIKPDVAHNGGIARASGTSHLPRRLR